MPLWFNSKVLGCLLPSSFLILSTLYLARNNHVGRLQPTRRSDPVKISSFYQTWCSIRQLQRDWERILNPCEGIIKWGSTKEDFKEPTDPIKSAIVALDIRPTYEFSRILIETRTKGNKRKAVGGDSWRIHLRGPASPSTTVLDHNNGTYEVVFLIIEPGVYTVHSYLEHSLCDGLKEPPENWFIIGNAQGKYQPAGSLGKDQAYLSKKLNSQPTINVLEQISKEYKEAVQVLMENGNTICKENCQYLWDGYGRWVDDEWHPYQRKKDKEDAAALRLPVAANHNGTFWLYGDSVMAQFYSNLKLFGKLCHLFTGKCGHTYNWVYRIIGYNTTRAKLEKSDEDINKTRILNEVGSVLQNRYFNRPQSIIFMNFGLHFTESSSFSNYMELVDDLISLVKNKEIYRGKAIWRTTTALNKHKLGGKHQHSRRFLTQHRVKLFNAYATSRMCAAGIPIFDFFSLTDSYPRGSGIAGYKSDAVHYEHKVFATAERRLEALLGSNYI